MRLKILKKIFLDCFKIDNINYGESRILTIAHDIDRSFLYDGKFYSPLISTIEDDLKKFGIECVSVARIISTIKGDKSHGRVYSPEGGFARALIKKKIKGLFLRNSYPYSNSEEKVWTRILLNTNAKKVIAIMPSHELCAACHKLNVWVADVQHGVIAKNHPWYGKKFKEKVNVNFLPDCFLLWDKYSSEVLEEWVDKSKIDLKIIGNRWISRFKKLDVEDTLVSHVYSNFIKEFSITNDSRKSILVSMSWGEEGIPNGILSDNIISLIQKTYKKYRWLLRLHPNQMIGFATEESKKFIDIFKSKLEGKAEWEYPSKAALPLLLKACSLHISWNSSVGIEAAMLGVKSAALDPRLRSTFADDYYKYYHLDGYISFIPDNESSIHEWIIGNINEIGIPGNYETMDIEYLKFLDYLVND